MSHKVSIIINVNNDEQKYLIRCINSIQRQLYKNREIIILSEDKTIDEAVGINTSVMNTEELRDSINKLESEWILFCNSNSVLAPDVLESLISTIEAKDCVPTAKYMIKENDGFKEDDNALAKFSPYGKLFSIDNILRLHNRGEMRINAIFTLQYLDYCGVGLEDTDSYIYDSTEETDTIDIDEISDLANKLRAEYSHRFDLNVAFAESCLANIIDKALEQKNSEYYQIVKQYVNSIADEDEEWLPFILNAVHISPQQYQHLKDSTLDEFMFYMDKLRMLEQNMNTCRTMENLEGYNLAQSAVALYRDGRLGLRTIWMSLLGWMKYKIKRKEAR